MPKDRIFLGDKYLNGFNVTRDITEAARWYCRAAEQGDWEGQRALGRFYRNGKTVPQDYVQAYMWFTLGAGHTSSDVKRVFEDVHPSAFQQLAKERDELALEMTPAQIARAQAFAHDWKPVPNDIAVNGEDGLKTFVHAGGDENAPPCRLGLSVEVCNRRFGTGTPYPASLPDEPGNKVIWSAPIERIMYQRPRGIEVVVGLIDGVVETIAYINTGGMDDEILRQNSQGYAWRQQVLSVPGVAQVAPLYKWDRADGGWAERGDGDVNIEVASGRFADYVKRTLTLMFRAFIFCLLSLLNPLNGS